MKQQFLTPVMCILGVLVPFVVYGASGENGEGGSFWENLFLSVLPFAVFVAILYWFFRYRLMNSPQVKRQQQHVVRTEQHMERMEQLMERLVTAVENKNKD